MGFTRGVYLGHCELITKVHNELPILQKNAVLETLVGNNTVFPAPKDRCSVATWIGVSACLKYFFAGGQESIS
jgi:hypothetical protein